MRLAGARLLAGQPHPARETPPRRPRSARSRRAARRRSRRPASSRPSRSAAKRPSGLGVERSPIAPIISRSCVSRYLAIVQPAFSSPTRLRARHLHVVEEGLAERRLARDQLDRPGADAGRRHVDQHEADAGVLLRGVGAHQAEDPVGLVGVGGPDLLAVDDEVVVVHFGPRGQRRQVGAGVRLRVALAPADLAARDLRQVLALLLLAAVLQQRRAEHPDAEALQRRAALERGHLLAQDRRLRVREAAAAVVARPGRHRPAALAHALHPRALRLALELEALAAPADVGFALHGLAHLGRAVGLQPGAGVATKAIETRCRLVGGDADRTHACLLRSCARECRMGAFPEQGPISNPNDGCSVFSGL